MPSLRDEVAEAYDDLAGADAAQDADLEVEPAQAADSGPEVETPAAPDMRARDESGKFTKQGKTPAAAKAAAPKAKPAPDAEASAGEPDGADAGEGNDPPIVDLPAEPVAQPIIPSGLKAPADWSAKAKGVWDKLPREAQEESIRLHVAARRGMEEGAGHRKTAETWTKTVAPYEHLFRQAGVAPEQAVGNVLQQYAALQTAPPQTRAAIIGNLVRNFLGTDEGSIRLLADVLDSKGAPAHQPPPQAQGLTPQDVEKLLAQREQKARQDQGMRALQEFEDSVPEHYEEVRAEFAEVVGVWERKNPGVIPTRAVFQKLYDRALLLNEGTAQIIAQRKAAADAGKAKASTQQKRAAAVSMRSEPGGPAKATRVQTARDDAAEAYEELSRR